MGIAHLDSPYEHCPTRDLGPNPVWHPDRPRPNFVELATSIEDVSEHLLKVNPEDILSDITTPNTYEEAVKSRHAHRWRESMDVEMQDLLRNDTWILVPRHQVPS